MAKQDEWITTKHAAELTNYSPYHIRDLIRDGKIKAQKFGEVWQVSRESLLAYTRAVVEIGEKRGPKRKG